jgi:capsular polysaccharide biosynthesis protein
MPRAVALVLLPPSPVTQTPVATQTSTQVILATSDHVLAEAAKAVTPPISPDQLKRQVVVNALSQQILQITASAKHPHDAEVLVNAVANDYASYVKTLPSGMIAGLPPQVQQQATSVVPVSKLHIPMTGAIGMGVGLVAGVLAALIWSRRDRRLRLRDEMAGALGVPVLASFEADTQSRATQWAKLLERYQPSPVASWSLRRVLHRLTPAGTPGPQEIRVVSFADDKPALAAGPQLATFASTLGISTALVPGEQRVLLPLRAACATHNGSHRPDLHMIGSDEPDLVRLGADLTVSVIAVDRAEPSISPFVGATVLAVSSGAATADDLARLALAAADAGQAIEGILLINPDAKDATTGAVAETESRRRMRTRTNPHLVPDPSSAERPV